MMPKYFILTFDREEHEQAVVRRLGTAESIIKRNI